MLPLATVASCQAQCLEQDFQVSDLFGGPIFGAVPKMGPPAKSSFFSLLQHRNGPIFGTVSRSGFWDRFQSLLNGSGLI